MNPKDDTQKAQAVEVFVPALEAATKELAQLQEERQQFLQQIDKRIADLRRTVEGLTEVCKERGVEIPGHIAKAANVGGDIAGLGLTKAIRKLLSNLTFPVTPIEIRDYLEDGGMDLEKYSSAMVAIHNTLKRLFDQGELARSKEEPLRYMWINPLGRMLHFDNSKGFLRDMVPTKVPSDFETR